MAAQQDQSAEPMTQAQAFIKRVAGRYRDDGATLSDLREAVTTLEDIEPIARRVLGGAHPVTEVIEDNLRYARADLRAREETGGA